MGKGGGRVGFQIAFFLPFLTMTITVLRTYVYIVKVK